MRLGKYGLRIENVHRIYARGGSTLEGGGSYYLRTPIPLDGEAYDVFINGKFVLDIPTESLKVKNHKDVREELKEILQTYTHVSKWF